MAERDESLAPTYFATWNTRDGAAVGKHFSPDGSLRDWDVSVSGAEAVGEANGGIFKAVPGIEITVEAVVVDAPRAVAVCEILVHLHDEASTVLKARRCACARARRCARARASVAHVQCMHKRSVLVRVHAGRARGCRRGAFSGGCVDVC